MGGLSVSPNRVKSSECVRRAPSLNADYPVDSAADCNRPIRKNQHISHLWRLCQELTSMCRPEAHNFFAAVLGVLRFLQYSLWRRSVVSRANQERRASRARAVRRRRVLQLMRDLEPHPLQRGELLGIPRVVTDFVYFIDSGVVSLVANTRNGNSVEVALVGREGVAGIADALGTTAAAGLVVQVQGLAYRHRRS